MSIRTSVALLFGLLAWAPTAVCADGPLAVGDQFSMEINFSNSWEEVALLIPPRARDRRRVDAISLEQMRANAFAASQPLAKDPLFVDMVLHARVLPGGVLQVRPDVARVHYFDDRGRRWTIKPKEHDAKDRAEKLVDGLSLAWRRDFRSRLEREMLEEQLLGAALVLLHDASFQVETGEGGDPILRELDKAMNKKLPSSFPAVLRESVEWYFREAVNLISAPRSNKNADELRRGTEFKSGGIPFKVVKSGKKRGQRVVAVEGYAHNSTVGVSTREHAVFIPETGLVLEGRVTTFHETVDGASNRFGSVKWTSRLVALKRAAPNDKSSPK